MKKINSDKKIRHEAHKTFFCDVCGRKSSIYIKSNASHREAITIFTLFFTFRIKTSYALCRLHLKELSKSFTSYKFITKDEHVINSVMDGLNENSVSSPKDRIEKSNKAKRNLIIHQHYCGICRKTVHNLLFFVNIKTCHITSRCKKHLTNFENSGGNKDWKIISPEEIESIKSVFDVLNTLKTKPMARKPEKIEFVLIDNNPASKKLADWILKASNNLSKDEIVRHLGVSCWTDITKWVRGHRPSVNSRVILEDKLGIKVLDWPKVNNVKIKKPERYRNVSGKRSFIWSYSTSASTPYHYMLEKDDNTISERVKMINKKGKYEFYIVKTMKWVPCKGNCEMDRLIYVTEYFHDNNYLNMNKDVVIYNLSDGTQRDTSGFVSFNKIIDTDFVESTIKSWDGLDDQNKEKYRLSILDDINRVIDSINQNAFSSRERDLVKTRIKDFNAKIIELSPILKTSIHEISILFLKIRAASVSAVRKCERPNAHNVVRRFL